MEQFSKLLTPLKSFFWSNDTEEISVFGNDNGVSSSDTNKSEFDLLLRHLELDPQEKLTVMDAMPVDRYTFSDKAIQSLNEIPKYIMHRLMIVDYGARAFSCKKESRGTCTKKCRKSTDNNNSDEDDNGDNTDNEDDGDDEDDDNGDDDNEEDDDNEDDDEGDGVITSVNPMDAFLALIHCCDDFLRQDIANKLCTCQLSVPLLLPHPDHPSEEITMLLWSLAGIKKTWKEVNLETGSLADRQAFVTRHPFPIVSFVRVGENEISKSKLLNEVMSDINGYHDFFFHKNCEGGGVTRKIVDGLVELCWYLPGGKEKQSFDREICFANLRGDALNFRKQFALLSRISSVILMLVPSESLDPAKKDFLRETIDDEGKLVFVFQKKRDADIRQFFDELKSSRKFFTIIKEKKDNDHEFFKSVRSQIKRSLNEFVYTGPKALQDVSDAARYCGIIVDNQNECWKMANQWSVQATAYFKESPQDAKKLFKLQLHVPKVANLEREKFRQTARRDREVQAYSDHLHGSMIKERELQERSLNEVEGAVQTCLSVYSAMSNTEQNFFLTCLKHEMDNLSLRILPPLQEKYQQVCQIVSENKEDKESRNALKQLQIAIADSSFGLEHIIREMTQIFEVSRGANKAACAKIAAQMLLSGCPLELMDGDSLNVSLKWLRAVFEELKNSIGDANIFVISVLGIQSSGKSTMLNTMFGLQFAVSAGRCTRGAFASLIPLSDSLRQESKYKYLLIVDTEGLRGSTERQMREHDNELATFAIGIADLTIVNIFGENLSDIQEFLQIAVHAFLKMKLVEEKRMCQIIHQNVASTNASNQLASERMTLKGDLDKMTLLAAEAEKCESECKEFNDVIVFDPNKDVSYIPSMLQGCPPMAPTSPEYGRSIEKVKEKIIALVSSPDRVPISISKFQERVDILWNAILRENFIFSFRNTKEVRAKTSLDRKFFKELVKTITSEMTQLEMDIISELKLSRPECRQELWQRKKQTIIFKAEALATRMKEEMVVFFDTNEDKNILEQWRVNTMNKIDNLKRIRTSEVENNCQTVFDLLKNRQEIDKKKLHYKKELLRNAKHCITHVNEGENESVYEKKFEEFWEECIKEIPGATAEKVNVKQTMERILITGNETLSVMMMERYNQRNFDMTEFGKHVPHIDFEKLHLPWLIKMRRKLPLTHPQHVLDDAQTILNKAIAEALAFVKKTQKLAGARCRPADLERMYHIVTKTLREELKIKNFQFRDELICDILLYCFGNVLPIFEEMEENNRRENDLKLYLEETVKSDLKNYFIDQCMKIKSEISASSAFAEALKRPIQSKLNQSMGSIVATELLNISEFQSKGQFHAKALLDMGEKNEFYVFTAYLTDPVTFLKEKLKMSINNHFIAQSRSSIANLYKMEVKKMKTSIFLAIQSQVSNEDTGINKWVDDFVQRCTAVTVTKDTFDMVTIHGDLRDFRGFQEAVEKTLEECFEQIIDRDIDISVMNEWQPNPYDVLEETMFGCDKCCLFCKALCDQTLKDHDSSHSTLNHRPQGIVGWHNISTKILVTSICSSAVAGKGTFRNSDTCNKPHPYKDYQSVNDYYKSWSIPADTSFEASSYWKWFMAKYARELAQHFKVNQPEIPSSWKNITYNQAKETMQNQYHI